MKATKIEWADATVNPWWGCTRVSEGCRHCYAEAMDARFRPGGETHWGPEAPRLIRIDRALDELAAIARRWDKTGITRRVFIGSMCDIFEKRVDLYDARRRLWDALHAYSSEIVPRLIPMILTKRPEVMVEWAHDFGWPRAAWAGTTCEDQAAADARIPHLLKVPARVRFLSCEPLLGPIDLAYTCFNGADSFGSMSGIGWVIAGGESGPHARPSHPAWFLSLRDQCQRAGAPFFYKQAVVDGKLVHLPRLDGRTWDEFPPVTR